MRVNEDSKHRMAPDHRRTVDLEQGLKQRLMTAAVLGPVAMAAVLWLPTWLFALLLGAVVLLGAKEWLRFYSLPVPARNQYLLFAGVGMVTLYVLAYFPVMVILLLLVASGGWCVNAGRLVNVQQQARVDPIGEALAPAHAEVTPEPFQHALKGAAILGFAFLALVALHIKPGLGPPYVLYLLTLIWIADSGAYFGGRRWGTHRLAPAISPGKTWEGVLSAFALCAVWAVAGAAWLDLRGGSIFYFFILSLIVVAFSIVGDLYESLEKRAAHIKDSGNLLPGHGGVLDRIDSITAGAPVFTLGVWWMG